jgi:hypothetical protein
MEGRGLRASFFQLLLRTNAGSSSAGVAVPDTVAFEHGFPRWRYQYDSKSREVRRSAGGKDLHATSIHSYFVQNAPKLGGKPLGVIAMYVYSQNDADSEGLVAVEYHSADSLHQFLLTTGDSKKRQGLLIGIVVPLELFYTVISVTWSPTVAIVRRRACKRMLSEVRSPILDRFVTFDGPEHHSSEVHCASDTKGRVIDACKRIADHVQRSQHLKVASLQAYFVMNAKAEPVLLYSGALFFVNPNQPRTQLPVPPTIMATPTFVLPVANAEGNQDAVDDMLRDADAEQRRVEITARPGNQAAASPGRQHGSKGAAEGGGGAANGSTAAGSPAAAAVKQRQAKVAAAVDIATEVYARWHLVGPAVASAHQELLERHRSAVLCISDVLYTAHSRFLDPAAAAASGVEGEAIEVPLDLTRCVSDEANVAALLACVGLKAEGTFVVVAPPKARRKAAVAMHPVPKLIADAEEWLDRFFADRQRTLRLSHAGQIEAAVAKACAHHFMNGVPAAQAVADVTSGTSDP